MRQTELDIGQGRTIPVHDILQVILDTGRLTKDDIRLMWNLTEVEYALLKERLETEKLIEAGSRGVGGFVAHFNRKQKTALEGDGPQPTFKAIFEAKAAERLVALLSHQDIEGLLGDLVYTIRRARYRITGEDRRGSKLELAAALLTKFGIDLFASREVRILVSKRARMTCPGRWHPGKATALRFVESVGFPVEYGGIPAEEPPADFEYLEGRVELHALQDFQLEVQKKLLQVLDHRAGRAIVTLPTGGGKTRVAVDTIRDWLTFRSRRSSATAGHVVLWLAHTDELCEQATACFREVWQASNDVCPMLLFRFWGGYTRDLEQHSETLQTMTQRPAVLVSTPQRLMNLIEGRIAGGDAIRHALSQLVCLVIIDEAHRAAAPTYRSLVQYFARGEQEPAIIGLTATPFRQEYAAEDPTAGTVELRELFRTIIEPLETLGEDPRATLQQRGYLAQPMFDAIKTDTRLKAPEGVDVDNLTEGDIERIDYALKLRADKPDRRLIALQYIEKLCQDPAALIIYFGPTVLDAECMAFLLRQRGVEAAFVSGDTRDVTRRKVISEFKAGRVQVLCNCEVLTTGFDAPKVTHVIMARPTVSQVLYEQMVGRGLRGPRFGGTATCTIVEWKTTIDQHVRSWGTNDFGKSGGRAACGTRCDRSGGAMLKQNPFSVYDFLGYFTPGALFLYGLLAVWAIVDPSTDFRSSLVALWTFEKPQVLIPFVLASYSMGHVLSFVSSVTVERYCIWAMGYPSKYLLDGKYPDYFRNVKKPAGLRRTLRGIVALCLAPISGLDWLLGRKCHFRELYGKPLDELLAEAINTKMRRLMREQAGLTEDKVAARNDHDCFRYAYHWAVENAPNHLPKMQNYVAIYGFLRTLTLNAVLAFWTSLAVLPTSGMTHWAGVWVAVVLAFSCYVLFMGFVKFYRRFSLEALMAMAVSYPKVDQGKPSGGSSGEA